MPSQSLQGLTTTSGWKITKKINHSLGTGGNFCVRYEVESADGEIGFLKAMDLSESIEDLDKLQKKVNEYLFEQNILNACKDIKMSRIVSPLDAGEIKHPNYTAPLNTVYYVIFEKANSNLRESHLDVNEKLWIPAFKALHHVALGIEQLHQADIAHQDIKPSNVLAFDKNEFKVSDLGRVVDKAGTSPFCIYTFTGDHSYKPTELFFGIGGLEFEMRKSCDMYMVGSLVYHVIEDTQINIAVLTEATLLDGNIMQKSYDEALPFLVTGFNTILRRYKEKCIELFGDKIAVQLSEVVYEMCQPDISKRGDSKFFNGNNRYSIRRYSGKLSNIVRYAKIHGIK